VSDQQPTTALGNIVATTGQKPWPPVGTFVAAYGQLFMAVVTGVVVRGSWLTLVELFGSHPALSRVTGRGKWRLLFELSGVSWSNYSA
jgi:hypothetical protein